MKKFRVRNRRPLIIIHSNIADVIKNAFGDDDYKLSHTFRNCGTVAVLQNYFRRMYCPTAVNLDEFKVDVDDDCAHYERWFLPFISSKRMQFYVADCRGASRFQRLELITRYNYSHNTLRVCKRDEKNCGHCDDCRYTLVALDVLEALKRYKSVFDVADYQQHRAEYLDYIFNHRKDNSNFAELQRLLPDSMKSNDCVFRLSTYHATIVYFDEELHLWHRRPENINGANYPLYARLSGDNVILFLIKNNQIHYVDTIKNSRDVTFSDAPVPVECERVFDKNIAIHRGEMYLVAWPTNDFGVRANNVVWEHFFLTEAPFTYNELAGMKNFAPING